MPASRSRARLVSLMFVLVHREAVPGVDERSVPHAKVVQVPEGVKLGEMFKIIKALNYLPAVDGGRATWLCEGISPVAIVTQEYREAWLMVHPDRPIASMAASLPQSHFFFRYLGQQLPEEVLRQLGGDPVRLPREAWDPSVEITWSDALRRLLSPRKSR